MKKKRLSSVINSWIFGMLFFLILLGVLNLVLIYVDNAIYVQVVGFLNVSIAAMILISVFMVLAEVFGIFVFPFNMFYPVFNAIGGILIIKFIFLVFELIGSFIEENIYAAVLPLRSYAILIVPLVILVVGYVKIFSELVLENVSRKSKPTRLDEEIEDIVYEFKWTAYNLIRTLRRAFQPRKVNRLARSVRKQVGKKFKKLR